MFRTKDLLAIDVYHKGDFVPQPLVYFNPQKISVSGPDFRSMEFDDFILQVRRLTGVSSGNFHYCDNNRSLLDGLRELVDANDYVRFLDHGYGNGCKMNIYIDEQEEPIMEWIEEERALNSDNEDENVCDDDVDSVLSDNLSVDHEVDDEVIQIKPSNDPFLTKHNLIPAGGVGDDEDDGSEDEASFPVHDPDQLWDTMEPVLGMRFGSREDLKHLLSNYAVSNGYKLYYEKIDANRLLVKCCKSDDGTKALCSFRLWATWMSSEDSFQIKSLKSGHNCVRAVELGSMVTYSWIGKHMINEILEDPRLSYRKIKAEVKKKFNLNVSVGQCRNAKKFALDEIEGSLVNHYEKIRSYGLELLRANPGSTVEVDVDIQPDSTCYFSKMYVCLKGVKDGWIEGCRRVIGIDGCFLKGICRGELLAAVGRDANNQMYPLAWAVVNVENKQTWKWFIDLVLQDIEMGDGSGLTIISDQHKVCS